MDLYIAFACVAVVAFALGCLARDAKATKAKLPPPTLTVRILIGGQEIVSVKVPMGQPFSIEVPLPAARPFLPFGAEPPRPVEETKWPEHCPFCGGPCKLIKPKTQPIGTWPPATTPTTDARGVKLGLRKESTTGTAVAPVKFKRQKHWAKGWKKCRDCGTRKRPHHGRGRCRGCYHPAYRMGL